MPPPQNATSSIVALGVCGVVVFVAGVLMLRAAFRARMAYWKARRTYRRVTGRVVSNKTDHDEGTAIYCPVVEFDDPQTGRRRTFSPPMFASAQLKSVRRVAVLCHPRGGEPILDERPFRHGFAGHVLFLILAVACAVCGLLALLAVAENLT